MPQGLHSGFWWLGRAASTAWALGVDPSVSDDNRVLSIDLSSKLWTDTLKGNAVSPIDATEFRDVFFREQGGDAFTAALRALKVSSAKALAQQFWGASDDHVIDRFDLPATDTASNGTTVIAERGYDTSVLRGDNVHVDVYAGSSGNDNVTGTSGNDILIGKGGTDRIDGGAGNDIVFAAKGVGSVVAGGLGRDFVYNSSKGGEVWGDYITGVDPDGNLAPDTSDNADLFWWAPDVTIMDALLHDRIVFQGQALTGGSRRVAACNDNSAWRGAAFRLRAERTAA